MSGKNQTSPKKIGPLVHLDMSGKYGTDLNLITTSPRGQCLGIQTNSVCDGFRSNRWWFICSRCWLYLLSFRNLNLSVSVHEFKVCYWVSFAKQHGMEMLGKQFCLDVGPQMMLTPRQDGLLHRAVTEWSINSFTSTLHQTTIWLCSTDKAQEVSMLYLDGWSFSTLLMLVTEYSCFGRQHHACWCHGS